VKLSTKTRYGFRAMLELAINYNKSSISIKDIARSQEISVKYLEHLVSLLKNAGLVKSIRGAKGGYKLAKSPKEIRLSQIFQVLETDMNLVECIDSPSTCNRSKFCTTRDIWTLIKQSIIQVLHSITLEDLVKRQEKKTNKAVPSYII